MHTENVTYLKSASRNLFITQKPCEHQPHKKSRWGGRRVGNTLSMAVAASALSLLSRMPLTAPKISCRQPHISARQSSLPAEPRTELHLC